MLFSFSFFTETMFKFIFSLYLLRASPIPFSFCESTSIYLGLYMFRFYCLCLPKKFVELWYFVKGSCVRRALVNPLPKSKAGAPPPFGRPLNWQPTSMPRRRDRTCISLWEILIPLKFGRNTDLMRDSPGFEPRTLPDRPPGSCTVDTGLPSRGKEDEASLWPPTPSRSILYTSLWLVLVTACF